MATEVDQNMAESAKKRPGDAVSDPNNPGWLCWPHIPAEKFAAQIGILSFKPEGDGRARVRMQVEDRHMNPGGSIHGGAVMSFIDMALFAGGRCAGMAEGHYVTLEMSTRFLKRGEAGKPLDAVVRINRQAPGGLVFIAGHCEQDGTPCYDFHGTLKRVRDPREKK